MDPFLVDKVALFAWVEASVTARAVTEALTTPARVVGAVLVGDLWHARCGVRNEIVDALAGGGVALARLAADKRR